MSKFKIGDRVEYIGPVNGVGFGVVDSVNENGSHCIRWLNGGTSAEYAKDIRIAPPVSVAPTLETATGADLDRIAEDRFMTLRWTGETDMALRYRCQRIRATSGVTAPAGYELKFSEDGRYVTVVATGLPNPPPPVLTFTAALPVAPPGIDRDVADYVAEHDRMRAALDKVRVFFASHRFDSLGVAAGREMREVMAVVLAALDNDRAGK